MVLSSTDDVRSTELLVRYAEHVVKLVPVDNIALGEYHTRFVTVAG